MYFKTAGRLGSDLLWILNSGLWRLKKVYSHSSPNLIHHSSGNDTVSKFLLFWDFKQSLGSLLDTVGTHLPPPPFSTEVNPRLLLPSCKTSWEFIPRTAVDRILVCMQTKIWQKVKWRNWGERRNVASVNWRYWIEGQDLIYCHRIPRASEGSYLVPCLLFWKVWIWKKLIKRYGIQELKIFFILSFGSLPLPLLLWVLSFGAISAISPLLLLFSSPSLPPRLLPTLSCQIESFLFSFYHN